MNIKATGKNAYFAASNSTKGFVSYYEEIFQNARIGHVWAIKGGPGTGKSRFLRVKEVLVSHNFFGFYNIFYCIFSRERVSRL